METISVFKRKEYKYLLTQQQYQAMLKAISPYLAIDQYGASPVVSQYVDTPSRLLIARSMEHPLYKEKLRIRSYGEPAYTKPVFFEIKKKYDGIGYKRRVAISYAAALAMLNGVSYAVAVRKYPLQDCAMQREALSVRSLQIGRELMVALTRYGRMVPSIRTACTRSAYLPHEHAAAVAPTALSTATRMPAHTTTTTPVTAPADLRITFDEYLTGQDLTHPAAQSFEIIPSDMVVMEVKAGGAFPLWLAQAISQNAVRRTNFSKVGRAYTMLNNTHRSKEAKHVG